MTERVLVIGLDGYEASLGDAMMAQGQLPALKRLRARSARFLLDHGKAKRSGLAWEHVSTGLAPGEGGRWAAVDFDPSTYKVWQQPTVLTPFAAGVSARTVVFDPPYFDLERASKVGGLVNWGAHDPGVEARAHPAELRQEIESRFGPYPAKAWIYGFVWPSVRKTQTMAVALERAVRVRAQAARWLLAERLPDWALGIVVVSEIHSAIEALWHGIDDEHPLHSLPSSGPAADGLRAVYRAVDDLIGQLTDTFPDAAIVTFSMHGMGPNQSDVASMLLLPELLYRHSFGKPYMRQVSWRTSENGVPLLADEQVWEKEIAKALGERIGLGKRLRRRAMRLLPKRSAPRAPKEPVSLDWMPAAKYQPYWAGMQAFALPSFYDGRVRINLAGREAKGEAPLSRYSTLCDDIEAVIRACRDPLTGEPVVSDIERCADADPRRLAPSESDLVIVWKSSPLGFVHPELGRIGPVPYRRTGGHTGKYGMALIAGDGIDPDDYGVRSSFDVAPTLIELLGERRPAGLSGRSLCARKADVA